MKFEIILLIMITIASIGSFIAISGATYYHLKDISKECRDETWVYLDNQLVLKDITLADLKPYVDNNPSMKITKVVDVEVCE